MSHDDEYGIKSGVTADFVIGMLALRTFRIQNGELQPITSSINEWENGTCKAVCTKHPEDDEHDAPEPDCTCGIYGALTLDVLLEQWEEPTSNLITIIAAEGTTYIGTKGLRTAAARIIAYCTPHQHIRTICTKQCPGARGFYDIDAMLKTHRFPPPE